MSAESDAYAQLIHSEGWKLLSELIGKKITAAHKELLSGIWYRSDERDTDNRHNAQIAAKAMQAILDYPAKQIEKERKRVERANQGDSPE